MVYVPQTWHDYPATDTPLSAARFTVMENGIADASNEADVANSGILGVVTVTADYTITGDRTVNVVEVDSPAAVVVTIPPEATVSAPWPVGTVKGVERYGAGSVTIAPASGVTLRSPGGVLTLRAQYSGASLRYRGSDEWVLAGDLG